MERLRARNREGPWLRVIWIGPGTWSGLHGSGGSVYRALDADRVRACVKNVCRRPPGPALLDMQATQRICAGTPVLGSAEVRAERALCVVETWSSTAEAGGAASRRCAGLEFLEGSGSGRRDGADEAGGLVGVGVVGGLEALPDP